MEKSKIYCFFPLASIGGTELVHLDILKALNIYQKKIYIRYRVNPWKGMAYKNSREAHQDGIQLLTFFKRYGSVTFLSYFLEAPRFGRWIRNYFIKRLAKKINKEANPIIIFWHRESIDFLWPYLNSHVKIIDIVHNNSNNEKPDAYYLNNEWAPRINLRVLVDIGLRKWIDKLYKEAYYPENLFDRIHVINHKVNIPSSRPVKAMDPFNVLFVGRDVQEKRFDLFLLLANRLVNNPAISFHVVGIENKEGHYPNIQWHGILIDRDEIELIYKQAHVLVLTSSSEGFPKVIAESMAFGCVPIVTSVGAIPETLSHEENSFLTHPDNCVKETEDYILYLSENKDKYGEHAEKAYFYTKENFDAQRFNEAWQELIQSVG